MSYINLSSRYEFLTQERDPTSIHETPTKLPTRFGEILEGVDPKVANAALLGTAVALKMFYATKAKAANWYRRVKQAIQTKPNFVAWKEMDSRFPKSPKIPQNH